MLPFADSVKGLTGSWFQAYLRPYFLEAYRPLYQGNTFLVRGGMRAVEFKVQINIPMPKVVIESISCLITQTDPLMLKLKCLTLIESIRCLVT